MKVKSGFLIRKVANEYVIVAVGTRGEEFNGFIRTNAAGAYLWEELTKGISREELVQKMLKCYEDLTQEQAEHDLEEFLSSISFAIENM